MIKFIREVEGNFVYYDVINEERKQMNVIGSIESDLNGAIFVCQSFTLFPNEVRAILNFLENPPEDL